MTGSEAEALRHCAAGWVLFHSGLWGGPMGFVWAGADGAAAGHVPQWESDALTFLERKGLVAIVPTGGARDARVVVTHIGSLCLAQDVAA